ncbi:hypothetical protein O7627_12010 [Solwaraspora sp. WMMD1047]|uniref:ApeA N-terminal domain 1-containing protein n=1 Tax=Solwaraspora sp. WMMD1047 TaxID=3016102 RepID=UPI002416EB6E|nr:HEPN domain-containing protein [Solwaraspora sp. WMMD1047]MDG4830023.1 hypothetical protein [Solwaraspora sp. WMMD1047]
MVVEGQFWLAGTENKVAGRLDLAGEAPVLELAGVLTAFGRPSSARMTIHGNLDKLGNVTLLDAYVARQTFSSVGEREQIRARYALTAMGLLADADDQYVGIRIELTGLEGWSGQEGLAWNFGPQGVSATVHSPKVDPVEIPSGDGRLTFFGSYGKRGSGPLSLELWRAVSYWVSDLAPRNLDAIVADHVDPLRVLTTICADGECDVRSVYVAPADMSERWFRVYGPTVWGKLRDDEERRAAHFIEFSAVGLSRIAKWISMHAKLDPLGSAVAAARFLREQDLSTTVFQLASAVEGMHRRFYDDEPRMAKDVARVVRRAGRRIFGRFGPDVLKAVNDGLSFIGQPTFGHRLLRIIREMGEINQEVFGRRPDLWVGKVKAARNRMAHQLHGDTPISEQEQLILAESLYWTLVALMLREAGVATKDIADALMRERRLEFFLLRAKSWMPDVYGDSP